MVLPLSLQEKVRTTLQEIATKEESKDSVRNPHPPLSPDAIVQTGG